MVVLHWTVIFCTMPKAQRKYRGREGSNGGAAAAARAAYHPYQKSGGNTRRNNYGEKGNRVNGQSGGGKVAGATFYSSNAIETDPGRIAKRQKQVDFGKNTIGYSRYIKLVPRASRTRDHPRTPNVRKKMSKRAFDGLITKWRRQLHEYDPKDNEDGEENIALLEAQRKAENAALASFDQCNKAQPALTQRAHKSHPENASTPGGHLETAIKLSDTKLSESFDEFDDFEDLAESMQQYGLTRSQMIEAARDDPELFELLRSRDRSDTSRGNSNSVVDLKAKSTTDNAGDECADDFNFEDDDLL